MNRRIRCIARSSYFVGLLPLLALGLLLTGCGKKTAPKPMTQELPPQVPDFQVQVRPRGVELSWSLPDRMKPDPKKPPLHFIVMRSDINWEDRNCLNCPPANQREIQRIDPSAPPAGVIDGQKVVWTDTAVSMQHAYRYQVLIQDEKGRSLSSSSVLTARVIPAPAPLKRLGAAKDPQGILLEWKASTKDQRGRNLPGELQFIIERQSPKGGWGEISILPVKSKNFLDASVVSNQSYNYRITPFLVFEQTRVLGESAVIENAMAPGALPPPPPGTVWVIPGKGALEVQWTPSDGKVGGYHVYRKEGKEIIRLTASPVQNPPYVDRSAKPNAVYFYAVSSVSAPPEHQEGLLSKWAEIRNLIFQQ